MIKTFCYIAMRMVIVAASSKSRVLFGDRGGLMLNRASVVASRFNVRHAGLALLAVLVATNYIFTSDWFRCPGAARTTGLISRLSNDQPPALTAEPSVSPQPGRFGSLIYHNRLGDRNCCLVIAHAGGSADGHFYTNSREAIERSYSAGRRVFEIDFSQTCDGSLVLLHDWGMAGGKRISKARFLEAKGTGDLSRLDLDDLVRWLVERPGATIVTDTKDDFRHFFARLEERLPAWFIERHFVIQVYDLATLGSLREAGSKLRVLLTIYKMSPDKDEAMMRALANGGVVAVTMPRSRASQLLPILRKQFPDLPLYVHGTPSRINQPELHAELAALGASGFYLD